MQGIENFIPLILIFAIMYFLLIRPQQKKAKEERNFRDGLQKGDKIVTIGGIYGSVVSMEENTALIQVDSNTKIRFDKTALRAVPSNDK